MFLEKLNSTIVGESKNVRDSSLLTKVFELIHEYRPQPLTLVLIIDCEKGNFVKDLLIEPSESDSC